MSGSFAGICVMTPILSRCEGMVCSPGDTPSDHSRTASAQLRRVQNLDPRAAEPDHVAVREPLEDLVDRRPRRTDQVCELRLAERDGHSAVTAAVGICEVQETAVDPAVQGLVHGLEESPAEEVDPG